MNSDSVSEGVLGALDAAQAWLFQPIPYSDYPWIVLIGALLALGVGALAVATLGVPTFRRWWLNETPRPGEDEHGVSTEELTLMEHLLELRNRLVISVAALGVTTAVACVFYRTWMSIVLMPVQGHRLQAITPTELIFTYFKVALVVGLILAMPVIAYEAWGFVAPGLTRQERKYVIAIIPGATLSFLVGVGFAYFALLPAALAFLLGFHDDLVEVIPTIESYVTFVTHIMVATGAIFELPLVMYFAAKLRLVNAKMLSSFRRYEIVAAFIVAAVVTPTPDPFNQLLVALPIMVLYEVGVLLARTARR